jgi:hypothetical protein
MTPMPRCHVSTGMSAMVLPAPTMPALLWA